MTDYQEEQCNEIEALESIYPDELSGMLGPACLGPGYFSDKLRVRSLKLKLPALPWPGPWLNLKLKADAQPLLWLGMTKRQTTANHHKPPQTTTQLQISTALALLVSIWDDYDYNDRQ